MHTGRTKGRLSRGIPLLAAVVLVAGCHSAPEGDSAVRAQEFREQLALSTTAIGEGDLERARGHLGQAEARIGSDEEQQKVESLDQLIAGAELMMSGDAQAAVTEWSQIQDPALAREVNVKAERVGMAVPETSESEATP
ncbi:MAG: hypothetical protein GY715_07320 [Planctomycetes bacterium]|nr:hypothetical protein [Planctomycetota bacterium]